MSDKQKGATEILDFDINWTRVLSRDADEIALSNWAIEGGTVTIGTDARAPSFDGDVAKVWLLGGAVGDIATVTNTITTTHSPARVHVESFTLEIVTR